MSPEEVVDRVYELISFSAGSEPDWPAHRALFTEPTVLALRVFPDDPQITVMDYDSYVVHQMRDGLSDEGYVEIPGERTTTIVGEAAVVLQEFAMKFRDRPPVPAFDAYSLVRVDGVWKIASVISDMISAEA
ncbi:MAG: hypothetical protein RIS41_1943 [Actinomycetota bacterium]|jgi:hypothetical protein